MIFKNEVFELGPRKFVLLHVQGEGADQTAIIIDKYGKNVFPEAKSMAWVLENATLLTQKEERRKLTVARDHASEASKQKAVSRWGLISEIVNDPALYREGLRWDLVTAHSVKKKCCPNTLLTALRLWWQGGQTRDALLGYRMAPNSAKEQAQGAAGDAKPCMRGRPATKPGAVNYRASRIDQKHYEEVIKTYYLTDDRSTVASAHKELLYRHYSYIDGNGDKHLNGPGEYPTVRQFKSYLEKNYSTEYKLRCRKGHKAFARDHRPVLGTVDDICDRPGQVYEMDSTVGDVTVVSSEGRQDIIGRPTVFIIIDRKSRLVVGWYVGLEKPSWDAALLAIFSVAEDKRALCHRLGLEYDANDWPAQGVMCEQLLVDRGESTTRRANSLVALGVTLTNLPSCRPDWKPLVEGQFRLTHQSISDLPGHNPAANAMKRRSQNYSDRAALTLEEVERIIVRWFIAHNRTIRKNHQFSREQYRDGVQPSPVNIFAHGVRTQSGAMRRFTEEELKLALLSSEDEATIDEHGIWVNGMCYQPANKEHPEWFVEGRRSVGAAKVSYDRRRVDMIYVHDRRADDGHFLAKLARHSVKYQGLSLAEAQWMQKEEEKLLANATHSANQESVRFKAATRPIVEKAKREAAAATKGISKAARRANTKDAREVELNRERNRLAIPAAEETGSASDGSATVPEGASNVTYLLPQEPDSTLSAARKLRTQLFEGMSL